MPEGLPAKPTGPVFVIGIARRTLVRVADRDLVIRVEIVIALAVDLFAAIARQSGNRGADGEDIFAAAILVAGPSKRCRIQSVAEFVIVGQWHLAQELRDKSGRVDA